MTMKSELTWRGRLGRGGFWLRHAVAVPVLIFLESATARLAGRPYDLLPAVALFLFLVAVWVRRLHDRDRSGWWLLAAAVPVLGAVFLLVECTLRGSSPAAVRYGDSPARRGDDLAVP